MQKRRRGRLPHLVCMSCRFSCLCIHTVPAFSVSLPGLHSACTFVWTPCSLQSETVTIRQTFCNISLLVIHMHIHRTKDCELLFTIVMCIFCSADIHDTVLMCYCWYERCQVVRRILMSSRNGRHRPSESFWRLPYTNRSWPLPTPGSRTQKYGPSIWNSDNIEYLNAVTD